MVTQHLYGLIDDIRYEDQIFGEMKTTLHQSELKKASERDYARVTDASSGLAATDNTQIAFVVGEGTITRGDDAAAYLQGVGTGPQISFLPNAESTVASSGLFAPYGVAVDGSGNV